MKISISVPDELWTSVADPGSSPSQVVQDALKQLALTRASSEDRITSLPARLRDRLNHYEDAGQPDPIADLVKDADNLQDTGYGIGVELGRELSWVDLETLPPVGKLGDALLAVLSGEVAPASVERMEDRLWMAISDWDVSLATNEVGDPTPSPLVCESIAAGLDDLRNAVRARLRSQEKGTVSP